MDILEQHGSVQHASMSTTLSVPWSDLRSSLQDLREDLDSFGRPGQQLLGQWHVGDLGNGGAGVEAGCWADQHLQRADVLLSLDRIHVSNRDQLQWVRKREH
jgi:hypothetical protein